jgi:fluoroquinolone transport system permease protein
MNALRMVKSLGSIDAANVRRDSLLRWIVTLPILIAALMRFFLPVIIARVEETLHISLGRYYPAIEGYALLFMAPTMCGMVAGFLLLDERDDNTLSALRVTPLTPNGYLAWRLSMPILASILITLAIFPLAGVEKPGGLQLLISALAASPFAPLMALALGTLAGNKVQGFALVKVSGIFQMVPLAAYFIHSPWKSAIGIFPTYWPAMVLWSFQREERISAIYLAVGLGYQLLLLTALARRFNRVIA